MNNVSQKKKVLVVGNSHAACLKRAYDLADNTINSKIDLSFAVTSGGTGPYFVINDEFTLEPLKGFAEKASFYPEDKKNVPITSYDAIVVASLGRVFGGIGANEPVVKSCVVADFGIKQTEENLPVVSLSCFKDSLTYWLDTLPGSSIVAALRKVDIPVFIQPYPYFSEAVFNHEKFILREIYDEPKGMYNFMIDVKNSWLSELCDNNGCTLLEYPDAATNGMFTHSKFIKSEDLIHPTDQYGVEVLKNIVAHVFS